MFIYLIIVNPLREYEPTSNNNTSYLFTDARCCCVGLRWTIERVNNNNANPRAGRVLFKHLTWMRRVPYSEQQVWGSMLRATKRNNSTGCMYILQSSHSDDILIGLARAQHFHIVYVHHNPSTINPFLTILFVLLINVSVWRLFWLKLSLHRQLD